MKKIISIAFAAILAGFAISCQKEEAVSDKADAVQYTFNIIVNDRAGFDSDASTKGSESHKYCWENGDKIFLFFKPTGDNLNNNTYATLTYDGSEWGVNAPGLSGLGEDGTLSAVYVYNLDGNVCPEFSDDDKQWTIATGNTFYNCETEVTYTVSGNVISASLSLVAPTNFVRFYVEGATGALTCDKVKGWKDIAIGSEMTFSNVTCTGYMDGFANSVDENVNVMEYYGRIVDGGASLEDQECKFSVVKDGKVWERTATPLSNARSFEMDISDGNWQEAKGKLPGLFTVGNGADGTAGTADDVQVRFSQGNLWYGKVNAKAETATFNFEANQDSINSTWSTDHVSHFYWNEDASLAYAVSNNETDATDNDNFFTNSDKTTAKTDFTVNRQINVWRTLSHDEWNYLFENHNYNHDKYVSVNGKSGIVIAPDGFSGTIENSYDATAWATAESNGLVFLPSTGYRDESSITEISENEGSKISCFYWTSTALGNHEEEEEDCYFAYRVFFQWDNGSLTYDPDSKAHRGWAIGVRLVTE